MRERYVAIARQTHDYRTCRLRGRMEYPEAEVKQRAVDRIVELNPSIAPIYPGKTRLLRTIPCAGDHKTRRTTV